MRFVAHTTGLSILPAAGGIEDQPHRLMVFFDDFMYGDSNGFHKNMNKKR